MSKKLIAILLLVINVISLKSEINEAIQTNSYVDVTEKGSDVEKIIKWRFPNANFISCCSTIEEKQYYLKTCNTIFNQENIECFNVFNLEGSIILQLKSTRIDFEKGVLNALSEIKDIGGHSTENHHKLEGGKLSDIKLEVWPHGNKCEGPNVATITDTGLPSDYPFTCEDYNVKKYNGVCLTESFSPHKTSLTFSTQHVTWGEPRLHHEGSILFGKSGRFTFPECKQEGSPSSSSSKAGFPGWVIALNVILAIAFITSIVVILCHYCSKEKNSIQPYPSPKQNFYTANLPHSAKSSCCVSISSQDSSKNVNV